MWGWPLIFSRLGPNVLLVCDPDISAELNAISGGLKCQTISPDEAAEPLPTSTQTVVAFTSTNELALVRRLRRQYPDKAIFSAAHDLAANAVTKKLGLPDFGKSAEKGTVAEADKPTLLLATPGADSPYLARLLRENGIADPVEYAGGPLVELIGRLDQFSPAAFARSLRALQGARPEFCMLLRTDVLVAMVEQAGLSKASFLRYLRAANFRVIGLTREDRLTQCAQTQLLGGRKVRSVWDIPAGQKEKFAEKAGLPVATAIKCLGDIARGEQLIEMVAESDLPSATFSLESLIDSPQVALQQICKLLGKEYDEAPMIAPYVPQVTDVPIVGRLSAKLKHEMIDRLGLHAS